MAALDIDALRAMPLAREPYEYVIVPGFVRAEAREALMRDYPRIDKAGSFPVSELNYGPAFAALLDEMESPALRDAFAEKFAVDLTGRPTFITVRGRCQEKDGQIHTDSKDKIITVLIYMNAAWEKDGGRLRLLRSGDNLDDVAAEVPPLAGTLLAFRRSEKSFHGHRPFIGERRVVQLNWLTSAAVARREELRHRMSAFAKKLNPFAA
jgi:hypothetical protein